MISLLRSSVHMLWMLLTVIPFALALLLVAATGVRGAPLYRIAVAWLSGSIQAARHIMGIRYDVQGFEHLPSEANSPAVLLVKHQSTYETFLMPVIMPHPLAYVFKRELLYVPFFGWAIGMLDMIHIDRSQGSRAFAKVVAHGRDLLARGTWVIMFPEGTRIPRGQVGTYKTGGARLAIATGAPVIPIAVTSATCWPRKAFVKHPGLVHVSIGPPITSQGRKADELMAQVQDWIEGEMRRLDPEAYPDTVAPAVTAPAGAQRPD
jgi:1-acyl-sn-glycerol-3-phosphate acyltransferase